MNKKITIFTILILLIIGISFASVDIDIIIFPSCGDTVCQSRTFMLVLDYGDGTYDIAEGTMNTVSSSPFNATLVGLLNSKNISANIYSNGTIAGTVENDTFTGTVNFTSFRIDSTLNGNDFYGYYTYQNHMNCPMDCPAGGFIDKEEEEVITPRPPTRIRDDYDFMVVLGLIFLLVMILIILLRRRRNDQ